MGGSMSKARINCFHKNKREKLRQNERKIDKTMIGAPTNFRHTYHLGFQDDITGDLPHPSPVPDRARFKKIISDITNTLQCQKNARIESRREKDTTYDISPLTVKRKPISLTTASAQKRTRLPIPSFEIDENIDFTKDNFVSMNGEIQKSDRSSISFPLSSYLHPCTISKTKKRALTRSRSFSGLRRKQPNFGSLNILPRIAHSTNESTTNMFSLWKYEVQN